MDVYQTIKDALSKHGDDFWNDEDGSNILLVHDIIDALSKEGLKIVIEKI